MEGMFTSGFSVVEKYKYDRHHKRPELENILEDISAAYTQKSHKCQLRTYDYVEGQPFFLGIITIYE